MYCGDDFLTNAANKVHFLCLSKYINLFDEARFTISVDDLSNSELIAYGLQFVSSLGSFEKTINIRKNTDLYEVDTFDKEFLRRHDELDGMVFFAHNKGTTNFKNPELDHDSVFNWICGMYYYNFNFIDEVEGFFTGKLRAPEVFYGTFLEYFSKEKQSWVHAMPNNPSGLMYCGTFYWINVPLYENCIKMGVVKDVKAVNRFFAEEYPGMFFDRYAYGAGLTSHNDVCFNAIDTNLYHTDADAWEDLFAKMGDYEGIKNFISEIKKEL